MRLLPLICIAALSVTGCYDSSFGKPDGGTTPEPATTSIRDLCDAFAGTTFLVRGDIVVAGQVTANDSGGNYYRTLCIEQDGAGMEIRAAVDLLYNDFPEGCSVTLRLKGLALGASYGVLQAGTMPVQGSGYTTDYIPSKPALDAVLIRNGESLRPVRPAVTTIPELSPEACGRLIRIDGLRYTPEDLTPGIWAGYKRFTDDDSREIFTYVRDYADFADAVVPAAPCSLTGILQHDAGKGRFILKLRHESDCAL